VNDKKAEAVGTPEVQPEPSSADGAGGGSKAAAAEAQESSPGAPGAVSSNRSNGTAGKSIADKAPAAGDPDQSLGTFLIAARERRGFATDEVVRQTRIPANYLRMMETNDYSEISDQLYLVPFLRRYASFLELDQEDVAMRFVREVQRADPAGLQVGQQAAHQYFDPARRNMLENDVRVNQVKGAFQALETVVVGFDQGDIVKITLAAVALRLG